MSWIQTYTGKKVDVLKPSEIQFDIEDIAHALSNLCRFGGHCSRFYSVAEHSMNVAKLVPPEHELSALLHDASEAYLIDLPRPLKKNVFPKYKTLEESVQIQLARYFNIPHPFPRSVLMADDILLSTEKRDLMKTKNSHEWESLPEPSSSITISHISPYRSSFITKHIFLRKIKLAIENRNRMFRTIVINVI